MNDTQIMLIDNNPGYRQVLGHLLSKKKGLEILGSFTHKEFVQQVRKEIIVNITIISYDNELKPLETTIAFVLTHHPNAKILVNSVYDRPNDIARVTALSVDGYIFKLHGQFELHLLKAIELLQEDKRYVMEAKHL